MFNSTIFDIAFGLISEFLAISLFTSALTEAVSTIIGLRARTLLTGMKQLLNDPKFHSGPTHREEDYLIVSTHPAKGRKAGSGRRCSMGFCDGTTATTQTFSLRSARGTARKASTSPRHLHRRLVRAATRQNSELGQRRGVEEVRNRIRGRGGC
jgi:hypothetical protein